MEQGRGSYIESRDCDHLQSNSGVYQKQKNMEINETSSADLSLTSSFSGAGYIEHPVSKFDTLAGIAIKYGVEVSDIKRMNALVTDLQMFALKSLQIPTPGKHPKSSHSSDDLEVSRKSSCEENSTRLVPYDVFDSFQSLRVKSSLLKAPLQDRHAHIPAVLCAVTAYRKGESGQLGVESLVASTNPHRSRHRKSRSFANGLSDQTVEFTDIATASNGASDSIKGNEKLVRRRQKSMADFSAATENLFKKNYASNGECFSNGGAVGKLTPILMDDVGDSLIMGNGRSSSTCSLQDAEKGSSSSIWSTSTWNLKTDFQALSSAVVTKSLFDGLPKSTTTKYKASMD